mgnify:CR=1 FL=1
MIYLLHQGVEIGDNTVIGAGSVVTKSIPGNVVAVGVPCKVLREITEKDKTSYLFGWMGVVGSEGFTLSLLHFPVPKDKDSTDSC